MFPKELKKPIRYFKSCVDSVRKNWHQISSVTSPSGGKSSLKIEFFLKKRADIKNSTH